MINTKVVAKFAGCFPVKHVRTGMADHSIRPTSDVSAPPTAETTRARFDWTVTPLTMGIVETVAETVDREVLELPPLYDAVDVEALESLFVDARQGPVGPLEDVSFGYAGCAVTVHADGEVAVVPRHGE